MTIEAVVGTIVTLEATFLDQPGGAVTDPSSVTLSVLNEAAATAFGPYTYAGATITRVSTGFYRKALTVPDATPVGAYTVQWTAVIDGDTRIGYETLVLSDATPTPTSDSGPTGVWYCTRESVKRAPEINETARNDGIVDDAIEAASRLIEQTLHRRFYPQYATRTFDWPNPGSGSSYRLWLDADELIEVTSLSVAGQIVASGDYLLRPDHGPPFTHIEIDLAGPAAFTAGDSHQRSVSITGLWGFRNDETTAGALAESVDASETAIDVTDSQAIGVGSIIRVDSERMIVTGKTQLDTGQNLQTAMTALASSTTVAVTDGTTFVVGESILLDAEKMLVVDIAGNNLIVKRAWDGSVLAAHTSSDIYAPRTLTVRRGALGTTAATHAVSTTINRYVPPGEIAALCRAQALFTVRQEEVNYGRTGGAGIAQKAPDGKALDNLWERARAIGRKARTRAV